jgi:hypothetical protein
VKSIELLSARFDVAPLLAQVEANPDAWNRHTMRVQAYGGGPPGRRGPHKAVSDIWVRYRDFADFTGDPAFFLEPHVSTWYPVVDQIPAVRELCAAVMEAVDGQALGGVLITRIPPGGEVAPHIDSGWHARHYEKFAVQLMGNDRQAFCFEDAQLSALPGQVYTFDNSRLHWVTNDSDEDRMTLITCIKRHPDAKPLQ